MDVQDTGDTPDRREAQDQVIAEALAAGMTFEAAGELAGCSARTVSRRMSEEAFRQQVSRLRGERVARLSGTLAGLAEKAVSLLDQCMDEQDPAVVLRAIQLTLTATSRFHRDVEVEALAREALQRLKDQPEEQS